MKQTLQQHKGHTMQRIIAVLIAVAVVGVGIVASQLGWFTVLTPPEEIVERAVPVTAYRIGEASIVSFFPFESSASEFALMRTRDIRVDPTVVGSRLDGTLLVVGAGHDLAFPTTPAATLGGLIALILLWCSARSARLAQLRRQAT